MGKSRFSFSCSKPLLLWQRLLRPPPLGAANRMLPRKLPALAVALIMNQRTRVGFAYGVRLLGNARPLIAPFSSAAAFGVQ